MIPSSRAVIYSLPAGWRPSDGSPRVLAVDGDLHYPIDFTRRDGATRRGWGKLHPIRQRAELWGILYAAIDDGADAEQAQGEMRKIR